MVRRRWLNRSFRLRWRRGRIRDGVDFAGGLLDETIVGGLIAMVVGVILIAVFVLLIWPVLAIGLELALVILLVGSGIFGRIFLRRPWTVEALRSGVDEPAQTWNVVGWQRSREVVDEAKAAIRQGMPLPVISGSAGQLELK